MIITVFFTLTICGVLVWCFYDMRKTRKRLDEMKDRLEDFFDKQLDSPIVSGYNKEREEFIERMTKLKLVYNSDTDEWDKLKELEE